MCNASTLNLVHEQIAFSQIFVLFRFRGGRFTNREIGAI